jgi:hypothetical protein
MRRNVVAGAQVLADLIHAFEARDRVGQLAHGEMDISLGDSFFAPRGVIKLKLALPAGLGKSHRTDRPDTIVKGLPAPS